MWQLGSESHKPWSSPGYDTKTFDNFYSVCKLLLPAYLVFGSQYLYFSLESPPTLLACSLGSNKFYITTYPPQVGYKSRVVNTCKLFSTRMDTWTRQGRKENSVRGAIFATEPEYIWELSHQRKAELRVCLEREEEGALTTSFNSSDLGMSKSQIHPLKFLVTKTKIPPICSNKHQKNLD